MNDGGDWRNWARLAALGVIWGAAFMLVEVALDDLQPLTLVAIRLCIAALILWPLSYPICGGLPKRRIVWFYALGTAVLANSLPFTLLSWAQTSLPSGVAGVFMAVMPFMVLGMSHFFVAGERLSLRNVVGLAFGFLGVLVLFGFDAISQLGSGNREVVAQLACLAATIGYASGSVVMKRAPKTRPVAFGAATMILAAIISTVIALVFEGVPKSMPSLTGTAAIVALAVFPTAIALLLMLKVLEEAGPPFLSLVNYQVPVWAVIFGAVFLNEAVSSRLFVALAMILIGLAISQNLIARLRGGQAA